MAKYKPYSYAQGQLIPVMFSKQILPGTFEFTLSQLIDNEIDLSIFDTRFKNDETGSPAYDPRILLKIILFAYSRGITSSRRITRCCEENIIFMALSANSHPHFTTISNFISTMDREIIELFREILLVCDELGLIGREMFAVDGCKLPSNASKEWSGTKADFKKKCVKLENVIERIVKKHREMDNTEANKQIVERDTNYISTLRKQLTKIRTWMNDNDDKPGSSGKPIKSNITDNESAKMKTSKGVIQGYNGVAMVDDTHQIIVAAEAFGEGQEYGSLEPMVKRTKENFESIRPAENIFEKAKLTADSGFNSEKNMKMLAEEGIDGYVADRFFRKRDPRFDNVGRYKERSQKERKRRENRRKLFSTEDFFFDPELRFCQCPAGKRLYRSGSNVHVRGFLATKFKGQKSACMPCHLRSQCLRHPEKTEIRQVAFFHGRSPKAPETFSEKMRRKIDSALGKLIYSKRIATAEPPFANIRHTLGLDRFSLRGKVKVNCQWLLYCAVHNLKKVHSYAPSGAT